MKILFCLNKDIYSCYALNLLLKNLDLSEVKIYFSKQVGKIPDKASTLEDLQKAEKDISKENFNHLLSQSSNKDFDPEGFLTFDQIVNKHKITVFDFENINLDGYEFLKNHWHPDLIISIRFGQIFKERTISLPKLGIVNLHSGILPDYQGIMATFWAMRDEKEEIGCTLHFVQDSTIDTGDIIQISKITANYQKPLIINIFNLYHEGSIMIFSFLSKLKNNLKINKTKQNGNFGRYFSYPSNEQIKSFKTNLV